VVRDNRGVEIDYRSPTPVYQQIADIIRARIAAGRETGEESEISYPPGRPIPSLERIRQETGADVKTIQRAVRVLVGEGQVELVTGKGTFVTERES
jgi:DNA-binding transcriptional regulator YhcF (GntR family)